MNTNPTAAITEKENLFNAILYSSNTPAFIWSGKEPKIICANEMAERFFARSYTTENGLDFERVIPGWKHISGKEQHSAWLDFRDRDGAVRTFQVRNSCLDAENSIWAMVLLNSGISFGQDSSDWLRFFSQLETTWTGMLSSPAELQRLLPDWENLIIAELDLFDFSFVPADLFGKFDICGVFEDSLRKKSNASLIFGKAYQIAALPLMSLQSFPELDSENGRSGCSWGFQLQNTFAGFFVLEGLAEEKQETAQTLCGILSKKISQLADSLELLRDSRQNRMEKDINDIVIENISEGIIMTDDSFAILYLNSLAGTMFGFESNQVIGHKLDDLLVTSDGLQGLIQNNAEETSIKYLHRRSGKIFPCQVKSCTMRANSQSYNIFILSDKTESEESRLHTEQLTQRAFLGDFASLLAHEIRNPINNMKIWVANIMNLAGEDEQIKSAANRIEDDCSRVSQLVDNILAFSKPITLNAEEIDLPLLLSEILEKWKLNFARKNIKTYFTPPKDFPRFWGDPRTLEQVFNNLIGNSVDALDNQGGVITLKLSLHDSETGRKQVLITESDNGPGIPEEKINHIFEPFMTTKKNGNGWGLAISKRIITSHKGTINVKSFQGGTVFEIMMPLRDGRE